MLLAELVLMERRAEEALDPRTRKGRYMRRIRRCGGGIGRCYDCRGAKRWGLERSDSDNERLATSSLV